MVYALHCAIEFTEKRADIMQRDVTTSAAASAAAAATPIVQSGFLAKTWSI